MNEKHSFETYFIDIFALHQNRRGGLILLPELCTYFEGTWYEAITKAKSLFNACTFKHGYLSVSMFETDRKLKTIFSESTI